VYQNGAEEITGVMTFTPIGARETARPRVRLSVAPAIPAAIDHDLWIYHHTACGKIEFNIPIKFGLLETGEFTGGQCKRSACANLCVLCYNDRAPKPDVEYIYIHTPQVTIRVIPNHKPLEDTFRRLHIDIREPEIKWIATRPHSMIDFADSLHELPECRNVCGVNDFALDFSWTEIRGIDTGDSSRDVIRVGEDDNDQAGPEYERCFCNTVSNTGRTPKDEDDFVLESRH